MGTTEVARDGHDRARCQFSVILLQGEFREPQSMRRSGDQPHPLLVHHHRPRSALTRGNQVRAWDTVPLFDHHR